MRSICAWCKADMGPAKNGLANDTHSICAACRDTLVPVD